MSGHTIPITRHGRDTVPVASARTEETLRDAMDCAARAMTRCGLALAAVRRGEDCELDWQQARVLAAGLARALGLEVGPRCPRCGRTAAEHISDRDACGKNRRSVRP